MRLVFQPAEEGKGGARVMVEAGVLDGVAAAFALHVAPGLPAGTIGTKASARRLRLLVELHPRCALHPCCYPHRPGASCALLRALAVGYRRRQLPSRA